MTTPTDRRTIWEPARLGPLTLRNRIMKAATFEGVMPRGQVTDKLVEFHAEVARGGAALTTVAYCAVSPGGRVHANTLVLDKATVPGLRRLTDAVHAEGALVSAQIGHAGLVANTLSNRTKTLAPSTRLSPPAMGLVRGATHTELDQVVADFENAARAAVDAGFDAIEVHLGHNYLLSSFMSPNLNKRTDEYGGSPERRAAFPRRVVERIRRAVGDTIAVTAKFNMTDGVPKGLWLDESLRIARLLERDGHLDALQLTGGSSLLNGMYFFRGEVPMAEFVASQPKLVGYGLKLYGPRIFPTYPFEEAFFLPMARQFREALSMPLILLGGINRLDSIDTALGEGFEFVAMARALLRDPDLVNKFRDQHVAEGLCIHCNKCMPTIYTGTRCVIRETLR
ncbi:MULTISPECIES: 4,4'-dithiodibutanoate disulfide reductase [Rhodococcus]|uniref:4,4'-dithiodibutanoate disulfide reductase n=1 Tax=Rhodococcus oxybenzonivorans TaxID=1990687 RepID=A0AAE4V3H8_9NOCA|nr:MULTISPECIES: 4,4'-dithiodibutanoate disulfide reductase [Rhodococcus]MDV7246037.1 4,4'-dithiodibutanoate disulfide reductase [Rhodococcus oxybenzonivorans]MDV7267123.1 4,4'-dithiodibutanoate disulfide reductase [Rhodococcus oxybenzonivorans]MDV7277632.1 4,4'-dithiodibutanoate disulfide reductase [Rhodococcus oxybenzonivorans]MDV7337050.1 4,4'-dithiodibutanoate disulfide reductase [Rhodococcus oxybenzonivorans]MDV7347356.1 4,4'-dithiodibutanoate disulfide reductase [Rhodococcus oxybenzonivo